MTPKLRAAWVAFKQSAKRELGLFLVMTIFALCAAVLVVPIVLLVTLLPAWTWWIWSPAFVIWLLFGDTLAAVVRAYRGVKA
jgi:hypothetical protein